MSQLEKSNTYTPERGEQESQEEGAGFVGLSIESSMTAHISNLFPPAQDIKDYDNAVANGAERIFKMIEEQHRHRIEMEKMVVNSELKGNTRGQWMGFAIGIVGIIISAVLTLYGFETVGSIIGGSTVLGLVTVFVLGKKAQKTEQHTEEQTE